MVHVVCNKDSALGVHHDVHQLVEVRSCTYPVCKARLPVASECQDSAIERDLAQGVVVSVTHKQVAVVVHCDALRAIEAGLTPLVVFEACLRPVTGYECLPATLGDGKEGQISAHNAGAVWGHNNAANLSTERGEIERGDVRVEARESHAFGVA